MKLLFREGRTKVGHSFFVPYLSTITHSVYRVWVSLLVSSRTALDFPWLLFRRLCCNLFLVIG